MSDSCHLGCEKCQNSSMRAFVAMCLAVLGAIGIGIGVEAGVGTSTASGAERFAQQAIGTLESGNYLQLVTTVSGSSKSTQSLAELRQLSVGLDLSDSGFEPLSTVRISDLGVDLYLARGA